MTRRHPPQPTAGAASASPARQQTAVLEVASLRKAFGAAQALRGVDLALHGGEVLALVGENGAGKSTLIKVLAGVIAPDSGTIRIDGEAVSFAAPRAAMECGIAVIHQEVMLCDNLSVAANLFLGRDPLRWPALGWIDSRRRDDEARRVLAQVGLDCDPAHAVATLGPAARQRVEIARALLQAARFVVMDEPSSSLDRRDTERLLDRVDELRGRGVGVLYVSHRLDEVVRVADRAVVLRDGAVAGELARGRPHAEIEPASLVRLMMGEAAAGTAPRGPVSSPRPIVAEGGRAGAPVLRVHEVRREPSSPPVSFELRAGEILGLFGLIGAGRTELLETLFGLRGIAGGTVSIARRESAGAGHEEGEFSPRHPKDAIAAGLALVPEDRKAQGLVAEMTVADNLSLATVAMRRPLALRRRGEERQRAEALCATLDIRPPRPEVEARHLSGGNQQKVVLGKWLAVEPRVLLLDEPTRGVDVGARTEIHRHLLELARSGVAILLSSAETEEILALADRVLVLRRGAVAGVLDGDDRTEEALLRLAAGADAPQTGAGAPQTDA